MPSERSVYRKIEEALQIARHAKTNSIVELRQAVAGSRNPIFFTKQYDEKRDQFVPRMSERVVRTTVRLCLLLDLIDVTGLLTDVGRDAVRRGRFPGVVRHQIEIVLHKAGVDFDKLNRLIRDALRKVPPELPTARCLWDQIKPQLSYSRFATLLGLLVHCGGAQANQCKIYLHIGD